MKYRIFGCKVNKYYVNQWLNYFSKIKNFDKDKKILIGSCVVTDRAKSKFIKEIKNNIKSGYEVLLTGCGVLEQGKLMTDHDFFQIYDDLIKYKNKIKLLAQTPNENDLDISNIYTKKFIVIQNGCDDNCSFCLSVKKRGPSSSRKLQLILAEIKDFENKGGKEIVLTGVNLAAWGAKNTRNPKDSKFSYLLSEIIQNTNISRIRISSLGPQFLDKKFFEIIKNDRIMPYFHLSVQSFSDDVLQRMNRNYNKKLLYDVINKLKNLSKNHIISIGADIIIGFPGETEEDFYQTLQAVQDLNINKLHVFPFSAHNRYETVPASKIKPKIPKDIIKKREKQLLQVGEQIKENFILQNKGKKFEILLEEKKDGLWGGWTPNYIYKSIKGSYRSGDIVEILL